jgi:HEAT repeat protein
MFKKIFLTALAVSCTLYTPSFAGDSLDGLRQRLSAPDPAVRLDAVRRLSVDYHGQVLDALIAATDDSDEYVRERAVQALGTTGNQQALTAVRNSLDDPADFVRWRGVQACQRLGLRQVSGQFANLINDPFWRVRLVTFQLLGEIGKELMVSGSSELASSPIGKKIRDLLISGLSDPDERSRVAAARALAANRDKAAFGPLVTLMDEASLFTREQAALGLGELGDRSALEPLIAALEDPKNTACSEGRDWACWGAAVALQKLTGQDYKTNAAKWRQWLAANK